MTDAAASQPPEALRAEFFETVRQIVEASGIAGTALGGDALPHDEPVRFAAARGSRHPDAEIGEAVREGRGGAVRVEAAFMGLTGPLGVLPDHYSELVVTRDRARDEALGEFLDLFNHRALALFYRAWAKYRMVVPFGERQGRLDDPASLALAALAGQRGASDDPRLLDAAGLLARRVRSPDALRRTLTAMFGLPVEVVELRPRRIPIAPDECTQLGARLEGGAFSALAHDAVVGISAHDVAGRFRVRVGPIDAAPFDRFFEPGGLHERLVAAVRRVAGATADFDVQLVLRREAVPRSRAGLTGRPTRLGHDSWLLHGAAERDRDDAVLPATAAPAPGAPPTVQDRAA